MEPRTYPRSTYEIALDAGYAARLDELHIRLYRRLHLLILAINFAASTAAFASVVNANAKLAAIAGAIIATFGFVDTVADFSGLSGRFAAQRARYLAFQAVAEKLDLETAQQRLAEINADDPSEIEALRVPAYNDNLLAAGRPDYRLPTSAWQRLMHALA